MGPIGWMIFIMAVSLLSLGAAFVLARIVLKKDKGSPEMQKVSNAIKEGAEAFLKRQYKTIALLAIIVAVLIFLAYLFFEDLKTEGKTFASFLSIRVAGGFLMGAICSGLAGFIGMFVSIRSNIRTASASLRSLNDSLKTALRGGAVSGITVVAMSLLGVGGLFLLFGGMSDETYKVVEAGKTIIKKAAELIPYQIVGFGFGASFVALFAQLGGGIYTKAADVGADLVGKVEAGIPEDDPRNPAVIADLVGDNVGDCAGRGADLFESTAAENIGAMILGVALFPIFGIGGILFPLAARAFGLIASILGVSIVKTKEDGDPMKALNVGYYLTTILAMIGFAVTVWFLLPSNTYNVDGTKVIVNNIWFIAAGVTGILTALAFVFITQYYTEYKYRPVLSIAEASKTGPATNIIAGFAVGLECTALPVITVSFALLFSYFCGEQAMGGYPGAGLYGTAIATMGMLAPCAYILALDTFGPITDNAGGIIEMSKQPENARKITDRLDAVGNTTKALTKGYAIGSAALAAFLLFRAYLNEAVKYATEKGYSDVNIHNMNIIDLSNVPIFVGALIGGMLVFLFSAFAIQAVGKTAQKIIENVREQFKRNPLIMEGKADPSYAECVDLVTKNALKNMVLPGLIPILAPLIVGVVFKLIFESVMPGIGARVVGGLLMVGTIVGILLATLMNNGGGAWDNAKKFVEIAGFGGGKKSDTHKATVVGDTVGDPFKDTAGPSIHVLIKLLSTITLVAAPLFL